MCMYTYTHISINIYTNLYIYKNHKCIIWLCFRSTLLCVCVYEWICLCVCVYGGVCICMYVHMNMEVRGQLWVFR